MTGGQLIAVLEHCLEFDEKDEFLKLCKEMSGIRNKLVHELARVNGVSVNGVSP